MWLGLGRNPNGALSDMLAWEVVMARTDCSSALQLRMLAAAHAETAVF